VGILSASDDGSVYCSSSETYKKTLANRRPSRSVDVSRPLNSGQPCAGDEIALRMLQAQDTPLLPQVRAKPLQNPPSAGLQQKSWETGPLLLAQAQILKSHIYSDLLHSIYWGADFPKFLPQPAQTGAKRGVILDESSTVTFLDLNKHQGPFRMTHKAEPKTGALYKTAASAAQRSKSHLGNYFPKVLYSDFILYLYSKYNRALTFDNVCQRAFRWGARTMQRATTTASALRSTTKPLCCNNARTKPSGFSTAEALPQGTTPKPNP
jgi:hypothetical protein